MNLKPDPIETLLKQTLRDDLPSDVEQEMASKFAAFRQRESPSNSTNAIPTHVIQAIQEYIIHGWFGRIAYATATVSIVIMAITMHIATSQKTNALPKSMLAATIDAIHSAKNVINAIENASSFEASIAWSIDSVPSPDASLLWIERDVSRMDFQLPGSDTREIWLVRPGQTSIQNPSSHVTVITEYHQTILNMATPEQFIKALEGSWYDLTEPEKRDEGLLIFRIEHKDRKFPIVLEVRRDSFQPYRLTMQRNVLSPSGNEQTIQIEYQYEWNVPVTAERMQPF